MNYRELIKKVQHDSGFSDAESEQALDMMVESLAERLTDDELKDFASQLPSELKNLAMSTAMESREARHMDMVEEFMEKEMISEDHAKKQILSAWTALKSFITEGQIKHIKAQLPSNTVALLY
jgi:uncharacterized protein (DUF2267 family)